MIVVGALELPWKRGIDLHTLGHEVMGCTEVSVLTGL